MGAAGAERPGHPLHAWRREALGTPFMCPVTSTFHVPCDADTCESGPKLILQGKGAPTPIIYFI